MVILLSPVLQIQVLSNLNRRGDAQPRVTGCTSKYKSCYTLQEARTYMEEMGVIKAKEIIKSEAGETTPLDGNGFYAVANRAKPGIYPFYRQVFPYNLPRRCS